MSNQESSLFKWLQENLWPIHKHELKKFLPLFFMLFLICFDYTILRTLKDTLVVKGQGSGAEVLPYLKFWGILPAAVAAAYIFTQLSNRLSPHKVFTYITTGFLLYFVLFIFVLYPLRDSLHPHAFADWLAGIVGKGGKGLVAMIRNWTFTSFYIISELWGTVVLGVLFWGFANEVTRVDEAERYYGISHIGSNIATTLGGILGMLLSNMNYQPYLPFGATGWEQALTLLVLCMLIGGVLTIITYHWMVRNVLSDPVYYDPKGEVVEEAVEKPKLSFSESIACIGKSRYLICIAVMVITYNLMINLIEVIWKDRAHQFFTEKGDFQTCMYQVTIAVGIISTITAVFVPWLLRRFGMTFTTMLTPIVLVGSGICFFTAMYLPESWLSPVAMGAGLSVPGLVVYLGAIQNSFSKAAKYTLFDTTKEMAFIPLDSDQKIKSKAAIDGIGSRLGKSGGSLIQQGLIIACGSIPAITTPAMAILGITAVAWLWASSSLGKQFTVLTQGTADTQAQKATKDTSYATLPEEREAAQIAGL